MSLFRNTSIAQRLTLGFGGIVLMIVAMVVVTGWLLRDLDRAVVQVVDDRYPKVEATRELYSGVNTQARMLRNAVIGAMLHDDEEVRSSLDKVQAAVLSNTQGMDKIKAMINTPKGEALYAAMVQTRAAYGLARNEAVRLLHDGQTEAAARLTLGEVRAQQNRFLDALSAMAAFQQGLMLRNGEEAKAAGVTVSHVTLGVALVVVALALLSAWAITRSIVKPLAQAVQAAQAVAAGDLSVRVECTRRDEPGQLLAAMHDMIAKLSHTVGSVRSGSDSVASASAQIAQGNQDLSSRTEEQASALEQTAATMEQLSSTVRNNADHARRANQLAQAAAGVAAEGGDVVGQVVSTMQGISDASRRIGDIIGVIDGIAFQTNILALNAAVEAARAGEQGRGFAVVASEVRSLAQRSAEAAKEIKGLITHSVEQVGQGTALVGRAGRTMGEIVESVQRVSDIVGNISTASTEQSSGIQQVGEAVGQMDRVTQQNAALVEQIAAAADSLKGQAQQLVQAAAVFKLQAASD